MKNLTGLMKLLFAIVGVTMLYAALWLYGSIPNRLNDKTTESITGTWFKVLDRGSSIDGISRTPNGDFFALVREFFGGVSIVSISEDGEIDPITSISNRQIDVKAIAAFAGRRIAVISNHEIHGKDASKRDRSTGQVERYNKFAFYFLSTAETVAQVETFDANGNALWSHVINDGNDARLLATVGTNTDLYVVGYEVPLGTTQSEAYIAKFNAEGRILWSTNPRVSFPERTSSQWINSVTIGPKGEVIVAGTSVTHYLLPPRVLKNGVSVRRDYEVRRNWIAQVNESGQTDWVVRFFEAGNYGDKSGVSPVGLFASEDGIYGWGHRGNYEDGGVGTGVVFKVGYDGALAWVKELKIDRNGEDISNERLSPKSISVSGSGQLAISGLTYRKSQGNFDAWVGSITTDGVIIDYRKYGQGWNKERIEDVFWTGEHDRILAFGNTRTGFISGVQKGWLMATLPNGRMSASAVRALEASGDF